MNPITKGKMISEDMYNDAVKLIKDYWMQDPLIPNEDFMKWRNKYFKVGIRIQSHQSVSTWRRYTNKELIKKYKKSRGIV